MNITIASKNDVLALLREPWDVFSAEVLPAARKTADEHLHNKLLALSMLGYSNICKNACLYCGMRAANMIPRYRLSPEDVIAAGTRAHNAGFTRIFLISGEDPKYGFDNVLRIVEALAALGMRITLAAGEYEPAQYKELYAAGTYEYAMKFEMSDPATFNRLNPSTSFDKRMASIAAVKASGMKLASGNIVDYPGQTVEMLADDIWLMKELEISWAPIIPFLPAAGTPLAAEGGPGDRQTNLREIALVRLLLPDVNITAQQPGKNLKNGLADEEGNRDAVEAGANVLFCDLLPAAREKDFRVIDERHVTGTEHLYRIAKLCGKELAF